MDLVQASCVTTQDVGIRFELWENLHSPIPKQIGCNSRRWRGGPGSQSKKAQKPTPSGKPRVLVINANSSSHKRVAEVLYHVSRVDSKFDLRPVSGRGEGGANGRECHFREL